MDIRSLCSCLSFQYSEFIWKKVYYTEKHPTYKFVIRSAKKYYKIEFEELFDIICLQVYSCVDNSGAYHF
jgi:hypothetical protein